MKKLLTFIPLGIGISAAIIYVFNVVSFRIINDGSTMLQILSNLKIYLYIAIAGFIVYFIIKILDVLSKRKNYKLDEIKASDEQKSYEPFENNININIEKTNDSVTQNTNTYVPNYDYVPRYHEEVKKGYLAAENKKDDVVIKNDIKVKDDLKINKKEKLNQEEVHDKEVNESFKSEFLKSFKYCYNCGSKISYSDKYCSHCGSLLKVKRKNINPYLKSVINVIEIVILILIIYFSLNMLFEYKEKTDSNFESPFKINITK